MASVAGTLVETEEAGSFVLAAAGDWLVASAGELDRRIRAIQMPSSKRVILDLTRIDRLDTAGAWLLLHTIPGFLAKIGEISLGLVARAVNLLSFFGIICITVGRVLLRPRRLRITALVAQMEQTGVNAVPIVGLLSFLVGVVIAYQGADQLRRFGAEIYTVNLLGVGILRELGVLMAAIIIAGRSGSAFTAQLGTMRVNEEIDALQTIGLDPVEVLVIP